VVADRAGNWRGDWVGHLHGNWHGDGRAAIRYAQHRRYAADSLHSDPHGDGRRPGAGPALALSLVLVAIVCAFTGLCYAELASMIPIAGSAYTYTYATLGELVAWIIGWDLILEYAFSNMSVSVGFAAHIVDLMDWFGLHPALRWISPAYLPTGLQDFAGNDLYKPGWHFGFNFPRSSWS